MNHGTVLLLATAAGMVSFFSPCSISLLPAYMAYGLGREAPEQGDGQGTRPDRDTAGPWRRRLGIGVALAGVALLVVGGAATAIYFAWALL